jgi:hypothetical protein
VWVCKNIQWQCRKGGYRGKRDSYENYKCKHMKLYPNKVFLFFAIISPLFSQERIPIKNIV